MNEPIAPTPRVEGLAPRFGMLPARSYSLQGKWLLRTGEEHGIHAPALHRKLKRVPAL
jgi:hypothetical protein